MRPFLPLGLGCLATAALLTAALPAPSARATRDYARAEDKDCSYCHVNREGGGPRNERGRLFEASGHRFGVDPWSSDENRSAYLRARSALLATWYGECERVLVGLTAAEELPGGQALIDETRKRYRMFPRTWLRSARKLLEKGARGRPNALRFLARLERQFPETEEGEEAVALLDRLATDTAVQPEVAAARRVEAVRLRFLEARTEYQLGGLARARELLETVRADPDGEDLRESVEELLAAIDAAEKAAAAPDAE